MTVPGSRPAPAGSSGGISWTRRIADEFWTGTVTPLTFSLLAETMAARMVREPLRDSGLAALADRPVLRLHRSHVYANANLLMDVIALIPGPLRSEGVVALLPEPMRAAIPARSISRAAAQSGGIIARLLWHDLDWAPWRRASAFDAASDDVRRRFASIPVPAEGATPEHLLAEIERTRDALGDYLAVVSWAMVFAYVSFHSTMELARRWAPGFDAERADLLVGLPGTASLEAHHELVRLGRALRATPALAELARDASVDALCAAVARDDGPLGSAFRAFVARHGHRLTGRDLIHPSVREEPRWALQLALRIGERESGAASAAARRARATVAIERAVSSGVGGSLRLVAFRAALAASQRYYVVRENMRYHADYFLARLRALVLVLGGRLTERGTVESPIDLCFLSLAEIATALENPGPYTTFVAERRADYARDTAAPPPELLRNDADVPARASSVTLTGEVAAPGRCVATARVVRSAADFASVERGDVLVARYTDPGWTPILEVAAGLVLESGGQLSHGAIVARELGIPALVNVAGALDAIRSGDRVDLDATGGSLRIIARA